MVNITATVNEKKTLRLSVSNSGIWREPAPGTEGKGLDNIKKRLAFLYPGQHTFTIIKGKEEVEIIIEISRKPVTGKMKKFKAVIVDDENLAIQDISDVLEEIDEITVVGAAKDIDNAEKIITEKKPDIVFLDIQLKGENGFDLLERIESGIKIIFVTAFDSYAIKAFEVNAMDYLLKPVNPERVKKTLEKNDSGKQV